MKIAFLTEMNFVGKVPINHPNARTEFAWMIALNADHYNIGSFPFVKDYDWVFLILPKGGVSLNSEGISLNDDPNRYSQLYTLPFVEEIKRKNKKVAFVQEGPVWYVNDFSVFDQFNFYNRLEECDVIFAHNETDKRWYEGWFPNKRVEVMPTLMIEERAKAVTPNPENKVMIGGNFCRWYGGFQSYLVASEFDCPIYVPSSHASRPGEEQIPNLNVLPRMAWIDWIKTLSTFKYGVHLMPTIAAGTFSLNCAYLGIPCIGNLLVDTQWKCHPDTSVDAENVIDARKIAAALKNEPDFYKTCSEKAKENYQKYYSIDIYNQHMKKIL